MTEIDWSSSGISDDFVSYEVRTGTVQGYLDEKTEPVKLQKVDAGPVVPVMVRFIYLGRLRGVASKMISEVERDYRQYHAIIDGDAGQAADVPADEVDDLDEVLAQEALWERSGGPSFTADDRSVIVTAFAGFQRQFPLEVPVSPILLRV